jgi:hypothetical protein
MARVLDPPRPTLRRVRAAWATLHGAGHQPLIAATLDAALGRALAASSAATRAELVVLDELGQLAFADGAARAWSSQMLSERISAAR